MAEKKPEVKVPLEDLPIFTYVTHCSRITEKDLEEDKHYNQKDLGKLKCIGELEDTTARKANDAETLMYEMREKEDPMFKYRVRTYLRPDAIKKLHEIHEIMKTKGISADDKEFWNVFDSLSSHFDVHFPDESEPMRELTDDEKEVRTKVLKNLIINKINLVIDRSENKDWQGRPYVYITYGDNQLLSEYNFSDISGLPSKRSLLKVNTEALPIGHTKGEDLKDYLSDDDEDLLGILNAVIGDMEDDVSNLKDKIEEKQKFSSVLSDVVNYESMNMVPKRLKANDEYFKSQLEM